MASIAEFTLSAAEFPLGRVFERWPAATLELDRVVPNADTVTAYFWVLRPAEGGETRAEDGAFEAVRDLFDGLPELRSATLMDAVGDRGLFRAEWDPEYAGIMRAIAVTGVTALSASGSADGWVFELRATESGQFSEFQRYCADHDIRVTLTRLNRLSETAPGAEYGLTPEQREALLQAYEGGYYEETRATDRATLASELGISRQAFAARLRRGHRNLIESTLVRGDE